MCRSRHHPAVLAVLLAVSIVACGESFSLAPSDSPESNLGGDGLPVQLVNQPIPHRSEEIHGTMRMYETGCWAAETDAAELLVIFPVGFTKPIDDGAVMRSPHGVSFGDGTPFIGEGAMVPVELLPGIPDGFLGGYLSFCDSEASQVFVMDSMQSVDRKPNS